MTSSTPREPSSAGAIEEPAICPGCGILAHAKDSTCESCGTAYASPPLRALAQPGGGFWVAVRATFTCNACRFDSPINHFERDDGVQCTKCGLEQKYDRGNWRSLVDFAHQVGDFGSGGPQGRFPDPAVEVSPPRDYDDLATKRVPWAGERHKRATPGNPLCRSCQAPVVVKSRNGDVLEVSCSKCQDTRYYERPPTAEHIKQLAGTLADENEKGAKEVVFEESAGVVVIACPNCAAPLENVKHSDGVMICRYCNAPCRISTQSHARAGHKDTPSKTWWMYFDQPSPERKKRLNQARQKKAKAEKRQRHEENRARSQQGQSQPKQPRMSPEEKAKQAQRKALMPLMAVMLMVPILYVVIVVKPWDGANSGAESTEKNVSEDKLKDFSFASMSEAKAGKHFGVEAKPDMSVDFGSAGVIDNLRITRGLGPTYGITVQGGEKLDLDKAVERLKQVSPNRFAKSQHSYELKAPKSHLRFDPREMPQYRGTIHVATWIKDDEQAKAMADALWAVAQYAAYGKPKPKKKLLKLVNGPSLKQAAELDLDLPIEKATKGFTKAFPFGECNTIKDINKDKTQLVCKADVDHPLLEEAYVAWPNGEKARVEAATFKFSRREGGKDVPDTIGDCLDSALGKGEKIVLDHASGDGKRAWKLGKAGDQVLLDDFTVSIAPPDEHDPTKKPGWTKQYADVVKALDGCK